MQRKMLICSMAIFLVSSVLLMADLTPRGSFRASDHDSQESGSWPQVMLVRHSGGLQLPVHIAHAGDESGRMFVVEQGGRVQLLQAGAPLSPPFLDIASRVSCCGERGLLSIAFPPAFASKGYFYVNYTNTVGDTIIARYRLSASPHLADPTSEEIILTMRQPFANHNGGQLAFGPDGFLYIGIGDGGSGGDPQNNAQNPTSLLGKLLRIDVESGGALYAIPVSNPFVNASSARPEIWALGLRNPWRFSFDRQTGDLYIGDVGQNTYEEVNFQLATSAGGENYGWNLMEGAHCFRSETCNQAGLTLPVVEYTHEQGCSVTGGMVYRGRRFPQLQGIYFYADYCSGRVWGLRHDGSTWQSTLLFETPYTITSFGEDEEGELYLTDYSAGDIYLIADAALPAPVGLLENPQNGSFQSGISVISGWVCDAEHVAIEIDEITMFTAAYGTSREDTRSVCEDADNGFGLLINWNLLGDGTHSIRALADGVVFGNATFTVATLGEEFLTGASGRYVLQNFPQSGRRATIQWQEESQNFVIVEVE